MATSLLVQLLFLGMLIVPAYTGRCDLLLNSTRSKYSLNVTPEAYKANRTYLVTVSDDRNISDTKNMTHYFLQALTPQNKSTGEWDVTEKETCHSIDTAILDANYTKANWTSPDSNITSVEIRAYIIFKDQHVELKTMTLNKASETTTAASHVTTPNSVSTVQSTSFLVAVIQLPLLFATSKLLS